MQDITSDLDMTMVDPYTPNDPRLRPPLPSAYPWIPLPEASSDHAKVSVSILDSSKLVGPADAMSSFGPAGERWEVPSWSFLIEHGDEAILFDLGCREDPENFTPVTKPVIEKEWEVKPHTHPVSRLQSGGYDLCRISTLLISHKHFDHFGNLDTVASFDPLVILGPGSLEAIGEGYPKKEKSIWPSSWLKDRHLFELPYPTSSGSDREEKPERIIPGSKGKRGWEAVGCFEEGVDWFGDGSLYLIHAPGHTAGQMMALARVTTSPSTYILLGADVAHSQDTYLPVPSPTFSPNAKQGADPRGTEPVSKGKPGLLDDPARGVKDIGGLTRMDAEENIMVLLSHEAPAGDVLPRWPENIDAWKEKGWKVEKEREVYRRARERGHQV